jgi:hypothetical protein
VEEVERLIELEIIKEEFRRQVDLNREKMKHITDGLITYLFDKRWSTVTILGKYNIYFLPNILHDGRRRFSWNTLNKLTYVLKLCSIP